MGGLAVGYIHTFNADPPLYPFILARHTTALVSAQVSHRSLSSHKPFFEIPTGVCASSKSEPQSLFFAKIYPLSPGAWGEGGRKGACLPPIESRRTPQAMRIPSSESCENSFQPQAWAQPPPCIPRNFPFTLAACPLLSLALGAVGQLGISPQALWCPVMMGFSNLSVGGVWIRGPSTVSLQSCHGTKSEQYRKLQIFFKDLDI